MIKFQILEKITRRKKAFKYLLLSFVYAYYIVPIKVMPLMMQSDSNFFLFMFDGLQNSDIIGDLVLKYFFK